ncbi:MAG TPA: hypothetical protein VGH53_14390 [Streptosporangiaceae bacterium]|jgi:hypothetical protein
MAAMWRLPPADSAARVLHPRSIAATTGFPEPALETNMPPGAGLLH